MEKMEMDKLEKMEMERQREEEPAKKKYVFMGRDLSKIPCFRESWIYGITGGVGSSILTFMLTSRVELTSHVLVGSTCGIAMFYFTICRYRYGRDEALAQQLKGLMKDPYVLKDPESLIKKAEELSKSQSTKEERETKKVAIRQ